MFVDPRIGEVLSINGTRYHFTEATNAPGIIYAEIGRKAKVYRLISNGQPFALKAFKPKYRIPETVVNTPQIARYQDVPGLAVAGRTIIAPEQYPQIIQTYPAFAYSVLMPWVEGKSWFNYVTGKLSLTQAESLHLARALVNAVYELERRDLAHCDLSSSNFIFSPDLSHVELIDIEDMFGHGLLPPKDKSKTPGYSPTWIEAGVWEAAADRFSTGILVSEILGWQFEEVREASAGDAYFAEGEFGNKSRRFRLLSERLEQIHPELANLFKTVWYAESLEECPKITDWKRTIDTIQEPILEVSPDFLRFDALDLSINPPKLPRLTLHVKNAGGNMLAGHVTSNLPWLSVIPSEFSCAKGQVSTHQITLSAKAPTIKGRNLYTFENAINVEARPHFRSLSGSYVILSRKTNSPILAALLIALGIFLFCGGMVVGGKLFDMALKGSGSAPLSIPSPIRFPPSTVIANAVITPTIAPKSQPARIYVTNSGGSGGVFVIDPDSNSIVAKIPTGLTAQGITSSPDGKFGYSADSASNEISVMDLNRNSLITKIKVGAGPVIPAISNDGHRLYVTNFSSSTVSVIDTETNTLIYTIVDVPYPWGIAVSPDGTRIAVTLYVNNAVSIYETATFGKIATVPVGKYPEGVIYQPDGSKFYTANLADSTISIVDARDNSVIKTISVGSGYGNNPVQFAFSTDSTKLYVANDTSHTVSEIDVASEKVLRNIDVGVGPRDVAIVNNYLYVTNSGSNSISVVDIDTGEIVKTITGFYAPHSIAP